MIRLLRTYLRPYRAQVVAVIVLLLVQSIANLYLPALNGDIIDNGVARGDTGYILGVGGFMVLVTTVLAVVSVVAVYLGARVSMGLGRDLRRAVFRAVEGFSQVEVNRFGAASLITRNTNDVQQIQVVVFMTLTVLIAAPVLGVGGVIMAVNEDLELSALLIVVLPLMIGFIALVARRAIPLFGAMQVKLDTVNRVMREKLAGVRVIRAFVRTRHEEERFEVANRDLADTSLAVGRLFALAFPGVFLILNVSTVVAMWFGATRVESGAMPIGNLTAFLQYLAQILFAVLTAVGMFILVPRAAVSAGRIIEVLDTEPSVRDPDEPVGLPQVARPGTIEFRDVTFGYPGAEQPVLHDLSFVARPGQTTAIVGSTGSGKSTLVNLIPRLYDVTGGQVLLDGVDIRSLRRADLWSRIALVPQKAFLFSGTVASNLRYGDADATDEDLWRALEVAQASDFVAAMPGDLEAPITQGGTNVSGGQRQRLSIARAIAKRAPVYVFDDSFSALDFTTDARLRAALGRELADATVLIVAQRVGTIRHADQIVVLDVGRIVGIGTHEELMATSDTYREIVLSQLSAEEAAA